jgi:hypothetical protein
VEVTNTSRREQHIQLFPAGAEIKRHRFAFASGRTSNELSHWMSVDRTAFDLRPDGKKNVRVTIRVPRKASKRERYAVLWAQVSAPPDARHNIGLTNRVGIRIYLNVGPGGEPPSRFRIEKLTPSRIEGQPRLTAQVRNTGGRALDISGTLTLSDGPGGLQTRPFPATLGVTLAPGDTAPVVAVLDKRLPNGPWKARLTLRSGMVQRTVSATITFPTSGAGLSIGGLNPARLLNLRSAIGLVLLVAAVISVFVWRRRSRSISA